jgi:UDP-N-acetylglucosamine 2-epimerase (non-hydrolysing)
MKMAPVYFALAELGIAQRIVHTGQHYDARMSDVFFEELGLPNPDTNLGVGSGSQAVQTAEVMLRIEPELLTQRPAWLCVYGDVNSTLAATLVASKLGVPIAHVEAGLRSGDWSMPEEINRLVTDRLSQLLFTPSSDADQNLLREGAEPSSIKMVGNCMIDSLVRLLPKASKPRTISTPLEQGAYGLVTLHRPATVDDAATLKGVLAALARLARQLPIVFPVHPRTRANLEAQGFSVDPSIHLVDPVGYLEFLWLQKNARFVVTDSGGVQEETTYLGVPCFTFRDNTERPVTCEHGTNTLVGRNPERLVNEVLAMLGSSSDRKSGRRPALWDGAAAQRIAKIFEPLLRTAESRASRHS